MTTYEIFEQVCALCESNSWLLEADSDKLVVHLKPYVTGNGSFSGLVTVLDSNLVVSTQMSICVPENCYRDIAEAVCRANCVITKGHFDLVFDHGLIGYRNSQLFEDFISDKITAVQISSAFEILDFYAKGFLETIFGNVEPKISMQQIIEDYRSAA